MPINEKKFATEIMFIRDEDDQTRLVFEMFLEAVKNLEAKVQDLEDKVQRLESAERVGRLGQPRFE